MVSRLVVVAVVIAAAGLTGSAALAHEPACERMFSAGGGAAVNGSWSAEATFGWEWERRGLLPNASLGHTQAFNGDGGYSYAEIGMYMVLSAGIGAGIATRAGQNARPAGHLFIGLPILLYWPSRHCGSHEEERPAWMPYIEPYIRPRLEMGSSVDAAFEFGALLKFRFTLDRAAWRNPMD